MEGYAAIRGEQDVVDDEGGDRHKSKAARLDPLSKPLEGSPARALICATFGTFLGLTPMVLFGPAMPVLRVRLGLGPMEAAFLIACPMLTGSLLRVVVGPCADSFDQRFLLTTLLAMAAVGVLGVATIMEALGDVSLPGSDNGEFRGLVCLGVLAGCGVAVFPVGVAQLSYWFPRNSQGSMLGVYAGVAGMAPALLTHILPRALAMLGFFRTYAVWFAALACGSLMYCTCARNAWMFQLQDRGVSPEKARIWAAEYGQELFPSDSRDALHSLRVAAGVWQTWALVSMYFLGFGGTVALIGFLPTFWHDTHSMQVTMAATLASAFGFTTAVVRGLIGPMSDALGGVVVGILGLLLVGGGALPLLFSSGFFAEVVGQEVMAFGFGAICSATFKLVPHEVPQAVGGAAGLVAGLGSFGGFVLPPVLACFPHAFGRSGYAKSFVTFLVLVAIGLLAIGALWRAERRRQLGADAEASDNEDLSASDDEASTVVTLTAPMLGC